MESSCSSTEPLPVNVHGTEMNPTGLLDAEFKKSISRFRKALFKTVVHKRDHYNPSDEGDFEEVYAVNSSTVDLASSSQSSVSLAHSFDLPSEDMQSYPTLEAQKQVTDEQRPGSPIQTTPRHPVQPGKTGCSRCKSLQDALRLAKLEDGEKQAKVVELTMLLEEAQRTNKGTNDELMKVKAKFEALFVQHAQMVAEYKAMVASCKDLEQRHCETESTKEVLMREIERLRSSKDHSLSAGRTQSNHSFDCGKDARVRKSPSLSKTTNCRRSESLKCGSSSQERQIRLHSPLSAAKVKVTLSPRASPPIKKQR